MQIDYALILSAGKGTRMGDIGKKMPKPLWPVFSKKLLELQVEYCHWLGIKKIYINTFFLSEEIEEFIKENEKLKDVIILKEDPLLDSGGAIHNMAIQKEVSYKGNVLLVNADQFLFFDKSYFDLALTHLSINRASLFGITVDKNSNYNETVITDGLLTQIKPNDKKSDFVTYSGLGLLKLDGLKKVPGISRFFETVTNFKEEKISFVVPAKFEYWDFGTLEIYFENIMKLQNEMNSNHENLMITFLKHHHAIVGDNSSFVNLELNSICLDNNGSFEKDSVVGLGLSQKVS